MAKTYLQIAGQTLDPQQLTLPASRENRDAWKLDPTDPTVVIEDQEKIDQLKVEEAEREEATAFEDKAIMKAMANATIDLVMELMKPNHGGLNGLTRNQIATLYRRRVRRQLRRDRGLSENG